MNKLVHLGILSAAIIAAPLAAKADPISTSPNGGIGVGLGFVSTNPSGQPVSPLSGYSSISWSSMTITGHSGDFSTDFTNPTGDQTLYFCSGCLGGASSATPFTINFGPDYGTFVATTNPLAFNSTVNGSSSNISFYLLGSFIPGSAYSSNTPVPADLDFSFTDSGGAYTGSFSFATPPSPPPSVTPEPSSMLLLGTGLVGMALVLRRRFAL